MNRGRHGTSAARGYGLLSLSVMLNAVGFHATKAALSRSTPLTISLLNIAFAGASFLLGGMLWRRFGWRAGGVQSVSPSALATVLKRHWRWLAVPTLCMAVPGWLLNICIARYGADVAAFLLNLALIFMVLGGLFLGERLRIGELGAIALMIAGAFLFSYKSGTVLWGALGLMACVCLGVAGKQLSVKHISEREPLTVVMTAVLLLSACWAVVLVVVARGWATPDAATLGFAYLGAFCCSVAGMTLLYSGYHIVGVARGAPFNALRPLAVLLLGLAFGAALPSLLQCAGGALILAGSVGLTVLHGRPRVEGEAVPSRD